MAAEAAPPFLSVVVAAWSGPACLARCLASLRALPEAAGLELIVVRNFNEPGDAELAGGLPAATIMTLPAGTTVPDLRAAGCRAARGTVVALLEDLCTVTPGWAAAIRAAHEGGEQVVGGPVDQRPGAGLLEWAIYFYDYGRYQPPCADGPVAALSGVNVSYRRDLLVADPALLAGGLHEATVHHALQRRGTTLHLAAGAVVVHGREYGAGAALRASFHLARGYAARRVAGAPAARRGLLAVGSAALPLLLFGRALGRVVRRGRYLGRFVASAPWVLALTCGWALGEAVGYASGPGDSDRHWS